MSLITLLQFRKSYHAKIQGVPHKNLLKEELKLIGAALITIAAVAGAIFVFALR